MHLVSSKSKRRSGCRHYSLYSFPFSIYSFYMFTYLFCVNRSSLEIGIPKSEGHTVSRNVDIH